MQDVEHSDFFDFFLDYIKAILKKGKLPYTGYGNYNLEVKVQDGKITLIQLEGKAKIKP